MTFKVPSGARSSKAEKPAAPNEGSSAAGADNGDGDDDGDVESESDYHYK